MLIEQFNHTIDIWIDALDQYSFEQLCRKPAQGKWSVGQVCMHLIENTEYYVEQIKICLSNNENELEVASENAKVMFLNNDFPDALIEGPPSNDHTLQPITKQSLFDSFYHLKNEMNYLFSAIAHSPFKGKTKHPGLLYFSAEEWFQFAEMHFRHHLRQKKRIDEFLMKTGR